MCRAHHSVNWTPNYTINRHQSHQSPSNQIVSIRLVEINKLTKFKSLLSLPVSTKIMLSLHCTCTAPIEKQTKSMHKFCHAFEANNCCCCCCCVRSLLRTHTKWLQYRSMLLSPHWELQQRVRRERSEYEKRKKNIPKQFCFATLAQQQQAIFLFFFCFHINRYDELVLGWLDFVCR